MAKNLNIDDVGILLDVHRARNKLTQQGQADLFGISVKQLYLIKSGLVEVGECKNSEEIMTALKIEYRGNGVYRSVK